MKRILVPYDFSEQAQSALRYTGFLAEQLNVSVTLLHIIEPMQYQSVKGSKDTEANPEEVYYEHLQETLHEHLEKVAEEAKLFYPQIKTQTETGHVIETILSQARRSEVDMIVMGTRGISGLDEFLVGSKSERIVRHSPVPVFTIRQLPPALQIRKIVFASHLKPDQLQALKAIQELQTIFEAELHLLYVNTIDHFLPNQAIEKRAERLLRDCPLKNFRLEVTSAYNEENGILHYAHQLGADLISMATHQRTGLSHFFSGSIAENMVNHVSYPLLTFGMKYAK